MYGQARYADVVREVVEELGARGQAARAAGIAADRIVVDPGLGFAKRAEHSLAMIAGLPALCRARPADPGRAVAQVLSRGRRWATCRPDGRAWGTAAAVTASMLFGAHIVRVHDVAGMVQVARMADAIRAAAPDDAATS